ncbi:MAG: type II toxin-antitoxin system HigB family toxin [Phycisphaeraceae bacterium]|nr:type II toxin-antitoxin system HigB family toxin [Phycisphaeraceae bacterium]
MRIVKTSMLRAFWGAHREAEASLRTWAQQARAAEWRNFAEVRKTFPSADQVAVASGRTVAVFNIARNRYRLIAAVHDNTRIVYTLMILTHKEYDRATWKERL